MKPPYDEDEEAPLSPAMERVQQKLRRLMLIGGGTLAIGILAVLGAIVYRIATSEARSEARARNAAPVTVEATVPRSARLVSTAVADDRLVLGFAVGEDTLVLHVDGATMRVIGTLTLKTQ